jgi:hypothetical protein
VADQTTFKYLDSLGNVQTHIFDVLSVRGVDKPWKWRNVPDKVFDISDGGKRTEYRGFKRIFSVELAVLQAYEDYIQAFLQADTKSITYQGTNLISEENQVVFESAEYENEWIGDCELAKKYVIEFVESTIRTFWPVPTVPVIADDLMYIKTKVKIEGTQASPETFTTNAGKLQYNYGTTAFPSISLLSYVVTVICNGVPKQDAKCNQVGDITQSGSNISFQLAVSDAGNPSGDGFFYFDIIIVLQAIV